MSAYAHPEASVYANVFADVTTPVQRTHLHMCGAQNTCLNACILSAKNAHAPVLAMETIANLSRVFCEHRASCRLPPALLLSRRNQSPVYAVRSRNSSKSTLTHDAVAAAVSHKHHSIIRVSAGLIQFVYGLHSKRGHGAHLIKILFPPFSARVFHKCIN